MESESLRVFPDSDQSGWGVGRRSKLELQGKCGAREQVTWERVAWLCAQECAPSSAGHNSGDQLLSLAGPAPSSVRGGTALQGRSKNNYGIWRISQNHKKVFSCSKQAKLIFKERFTFSHSLVRGRKSNACLPELKGEQEASLSSP